jgi:hypothetical protein
MPRVGFESTIPVFERTKTIHALDCAATVIGKESSYLTENALRLHYKINRLTVFREITVII